MTQKIHLQQIDSSGASSGQVISWDATNNAWVPSTPTGGGGSSNTSMSASDILTSIKTVDGASSGLDADLLDGQEGSYYLNAGNLTGTVPTARLPAFTGDATSSSGSASLTLATVNSNVGTFGNTSAIPVVTVNAKGLVTAVSTTDLSTKANTASPTFTGTPTAPTATAATNNTQIATTAFVQTAVAGASGGTKGFGTFYAGKPTANEVIGGGVAPYAFNITAANCRARAGTAAAASTVFSIRKNGSQVGTVTFSASGSVGAFSITTAAVAVGDIMTIVAPGTADSAISDIAFSIIA